MSFLLGRVRSKRSAVSLVLFVMLFCSTAGTALAQSSSGRMPSTTRELSDGAVPEIRSAQPQAIRDTQEQRLKSLEERLRSLEEEIGLLKEDLRTARAPMGPEQTGGARLVLASAVIPTPGEVATASPQAPAPVEPQAGAAQLPNYGGASATAKVFNPDMGVIGNFVAGMGRNQINPVPALSLQESEVSLQAIVDPYARADFFLAYGEQGVEVEEGYVTFPALPGGFRLRGGKMRAAFGRVNAFHNHTLPWVDRPLVTFNLLGGSLEEADIGIKDAGVSVSRILPAPKGIFLEATGEMYRGDSGSLFQASRRSDASAVAHLKGYGDFTENTNLELGFSYARGHNDTGSNFITELYGLDATLRWKPVRRAIYHSLAARTEAMWSRREETLATQRAFGFYGSLEYQLSRRWFTGGRYDWTERARNAAQHDSGGSLVLTYWPSEFNQIRGQLRRTRYAEGTTANEFLVQFLFTLGAHGAHPF